ncbi:hypothetical protein BANRA_05102 [Klebsiella pneumoniae]|nr:hypothetical protein BANRA_05102 [Klebsiella pneumoniae]
MKENDIAGILTSTRTIALVGASDKPDRPSYRVMKYLLDQGITLSRFRRRWRATLLGQQGMRRSPTFRKRSTWLMSSVIQKRRGV